jgi:methylated-DNA-[protein]-cysteine S-methyltransferase
MEIPYGVTTTYGRVAVDLGRPKGSRAVGAAVGSNPISIVIPCHRVIGANGSLTGYGGGLDNKVALLKLEGVAL